MQKEIALFDAAVRKDPEVLLYSEMTNFQSSFLAGAIREYKPGKVLELGVSSGASSIQILNALEMSGIKSKVYGCDLSKKYYLDKGATVRDTGFLIKDRLNMFSNDYQLLTGDYFPRFKADVGKDIDMVLLDTVHALPGELLDFLAIVPLMSQECLVVLHDVSLNMDVPYGYATKVLLDVVSSEKKYWYEEEGRYGNCSNIAAFVVDDLTRKNIKDVFSALTITWHYLPGDEELSLYRKEYQSNYSEEEVSLFDVSVLINKKIHLDKKNKSKEKLYNEIRDRKVYIWGTGKKGISLYKVLKDDGIDVQGFISSSKSDNTENQERVWLPNDIINMQMKDDVMIVLAFDHERYGEVKELVCMNQSHIIPNYMVTYEDVNNIASI